MRKNSRYMLTIVLVLVFAFVVSTPYAFAVGNNHSNDAAKENRDEMRPGVERLLEFAYGEVEKSENSEEPVNSSRPEKPKNFAVSGEVVGVVDGGVMVSVNHAGGEMKDFRGETIYIEIDEETRLVGVDSVDEVFQGMRFRASGRVIDETPVARIATFRTVKFVLNGRIVSAEEGNLTVSVKSATKSAKDYKGENVEVVYDDKTVIVYPESTNTVELAPGVYVNVIGWFKGDDIYAGKIMVKAKPVSEDEVIEGGNGNGETTETPEFEDEVIEGENGNGETIETSELPEFEDNGNEETTNTTEALNGEEHGYQNSWRTRVMNSFNYVVEKLRSVANFLENLFGVFS